MKVLKECPILIGIVVVAIALSVVSFIYKDTTYARFAGAFDSGDAPLLSLALKGALEEVYPWSSQSPDMLDLDGDGIPDIQEAPSELEPVEEVASEEPSEAEDDMQIIEETALEPEEEVYELTPVDEDYFLDAAFIGDSRTVGLSEYCEALDTRATFYSKISLTIYDVFKKEFIATDEGKIGLEQALTDNQYGKIYIMLGLNEIGTGTPEYFRDAYAQVVDRLKELQPDAIIYIQGIMHVTAEKSDHDKYFNNENIDRRNEAISELADNKTVFYIDMNESVDDADGNLDAELSFDGVHLRASSYERWYEYLLNHAIVR